MSTLKGKIVVGISLLLVLIIASGAIFIEHAKVTSPTTQTVNYALYHRTHPAAEIAVSDHGAQSTTANEATTTSNPWGIAIDPLRGFVWVAEPGCNALPTCPSTFPALISKYAQADGSFIQDYQEPAGYSSPLFVAVDSNGNVWFTEPNSDAIGELDLQHNQWHQWSLPSKSVPYDLVFDKNGNLWFSEFEGNRIGFFNPATQQLVENPIPTAESNPYGMTRDPQGTIWFTENKAGVGQIASFTPTTSGKVTIVEHAVPTNQPHLITADKSGTIWFSEAFAGSIGEYNPKTGTTINYPVSLGICPNPASCPGTHISGISVDQLGRVWFTDSLSARVGYLIPSTGQVIATRLNKADAHPHDGLLVDNYGTIWFTEQNGFLLVMWPRKSIK